jgi:hypothetical protein
VEALVWLTAELLVAMVAAALTAIIKSWGLVLVGGYLLGVAVAAAMAAFLDPDEWLVEDRWGWFVIGIGVTSVLLPGWGVGIGFGWWARSRYDQRLARRMNH